MVAKGNTGVRQLPARFHSIRGHFLGVVEVGVQPNGMIFLQHINQVVCYPHGHDHRGSGSQSYDFHMGNFPEFAKDVFKHIVIYQQAVASGEEYVSDFRALFDIFYTLVNVVHASCCVVLPCQSSAGAVSAVHGALVCDQEENSVGISVGQSRSRRVFILVQRIQHIRFAPVGFRNNRHSLHSYRASGIVGIHQGCIVRGNSQAEVLDYFIDVLFFLFGKVDDFLQLLDRCNPVLHLPLPVVPLGFRYILVSFNVFPIPCHNKFPPIGTFFGKYLFMHTSR